MDKKAVGIRSAIGNIFVSVAFCFGLLLSSGHAQTWNSNAGGYNTGYGTVYGSFGLAMATQNMYNTMQMNMQRSIMRSAMIKKWGLAAVEKAERAARGSSGTSSSSGQSSAGPVVSAPPPVPKKYGVFKPETTVEPGKNIADALGETPEEKALLKKIVQATKTSFETQPSAAKLKNNLAGAFAFFIVATSTIYHEAEEPSDETVETLFYAINQSLDEIPEFGRMPNREKQKLYNTLIGMAAIPLATYTEGKGNGDAATIKTARQLAGELIKIVLKVEPDKVRFANGTITFGN